MNSAAPLFAFERLSIGYMDGSGAATPIVRGLDLALGAAETLGIVGESGCGKSTALLAMLGFLKPGLRRLGGTARFQNEDLFALPPRRLVQLRGGAIGFVPQDATQSLTPTMRVGRVLAEALALHGTLAAGARRERALALLRMVRFNEPEAILARYPHELSGGQQQRVAIALALAGEPKLLLLDEPTTALDVTTRAYILDLLNDLRREHHIALIYVSHDLGVIARVCDRIAVMYAGELVEAGPTQDVLRRPAHPYTHGLLRSIPHLQGGGVPVPMPGQPPGFAAERQGCAFAPRCPLAETRCQELAPHLAGADEIHVARCHRSDAVRRLDGDEAVPVATSPTAPAGRQLLNVERLSIGYRRRSLLDRLLGRPEPQATVAEVSLSVARGEVLALVGESGSGKSTILRALAGLWPAQSGRAVFDGKHDVSQLAPTRPRAVLKQIQIVFQNPDDSLNPRQSVAQILGSPLKLYFGLSGEAARGRCLELLQAVRLGPQHLDRLPSQLSGGEKQRVAIARAFAAEPDLLLCDEVTSALDVSVQAAVLALLLQLRRERDATLLFVSHDLAVVRVISDHVAILYRGELCEIGSVAEIFRPPYHPYTEALLSAVLEPETEAQTRHILLREPTQAPSGVGCSFAGRCPRQLGAVCESEAPPWQTGFGSHRLRCHLPLPDLRAAQQP